MRKNRGNDDPPDALAVADMYRQIEASSEFQQLRKRLLAFAVPVTALFLTWYGTYVVLGTFAPDFMAQPIAGSSINVGLVLGLAQFATTFLITAVYVWFANHRLEPLAERIRLEWR